MERGAWWAIVCGVAKGQTTEWLSMRTAQSFKKLLWHHWLNWHEFERTLGDGAFFFHKTAWLFEVFCVTIQIKKFFVLVLWKMPLIIWEGLLWICRLPWVVIFDNIDSSHASVVFSFFHQCLRVFRKQVSLSRFIPVIYSFCFDGKWGLFP